MAGDEDLDTMRAQSAKSFSSFRLSWRPLWSGRPANLCLITSNRCRQSSCATTRYFLWDKNHLHDFLLLACVQLI